MIDDDDDDTAEVDEFLDEYKYIDCRANRHDYPRLKPWEGWEIIGSGAQQVYARRRRCKVCKTVCVERKNNRCQRLNSRYEDRPDDYKSKEGMRITPTDVFRWGIQKMLAQQAEPTRPRRTARRRKGTS